jgi:glycosyltransferase involved in cell wall biosynthesis
VRGTGGGPEKTILLGTAATDDRRFKIVVCYLRDRRDDVFAIDKWAKRLGIEYIELYERHSFDKSIWPDLRRIVQERRIDIVHAHDYKTNVLAWLLAKAEGVRPLSTVHGWTGHSARERFLYYPADKWLLGRFPRLIAVSSEIKSELVRRGASEDRITVVLNGIDHVKFSLDLALQPLARQHFGIADQEYVIGAIGRLEPQKRFDLLLQAIATLRVRRPNVRLLIVGEGSSRSDLEKRIQELGLMSICHLLGHRSDVVDVHHALDLFVQSSDYEGTPNAVLEAMALGTPVIATDVGGTAELIEHGTHGLIVRPGDPQALAAAIDRGIADPGVGRARARAARERVERELSFERRMQRVEAVYDELMRSRRPVPTEPVEASL